MDIHLRDLLPFPIDEKHARTSEIWGSRLDLMAGQRYYIMAASGRGKSTFVHTLYGLRKDYSGTVCWGGQEIKGVSETTWAAWRAEKISILFQDMRLFADLTVEENLRVKHALSPDLPIDTLKSWTERMGMGSKWTQIAGTLSYGEQQRVAILRSLIQPFEWLLMDEPFSHLDENNARIARELITARVASLGAGMIWLDLSAPTASEELHLLQL